MCCLLAMVGCRNAQPLYLGEGRELSHYMNQATQIEYPDVDTSGMDSIPEGVEPRTLENEGPTEIWDLTLEQVVQIALANGKVMTDLGGRIVSSPGLTPTEYDPAIAESDPRLGVEAALSQFDAQFATSMFWERNDRVINNLLLGGGVNELQQDVGAFESSISKRAATGSQFAVRHTVDYDWNNQPFNIFPSAYHAIAEVEARHPLLRGGGIAFNRIYGPDATPALRFRNGVLLARIDEDVSLTEFEAGVRDFVSNVENAYWDLYFAYRQLDARITARDGALATWRRVRELGRLGAEGGEAPVEARAGAEFFEFRAQVEDALSGGPGGGTHTGVGSRSGEFSGTGGLYERESDLRLLMGLPLNDGRLIRPADEPTTAKIALDWSAMVSESLARRVEIRRQRWMVKRRELELTASKNFLLPRFDVVARYRWRGFGNDLIRPDSSGSPQFDNAYQTLTDGDYQEWTTGFEFSMPIGFREGLTAVRNAELQLARERAILEKQERAIEHDLAGAVRELHRAYTVSQTNYNAWLKSNERIEAINRAIDAGLFTQDDELDAVRDRAEAEVRYFRSLVEYNLAIKAVNFEKGALLDYCGVHLSEGPWPRQAYENARDQARQRSAALRLDYGYSSPGPISRGVVPQGTAAGSEHLPALEGPELPTESIPRPPELLPAPNASQIRRPVVQPTFDRPVSAEAVRNPVVTAVSPYPFAPNSPAANPVVVAATDQPHSPVQYPVVQAVGNAEFASPMLRSMVGRTSHEVPQIPQVPQTPAPVVRPVPNAGVPRLLPPPPIHAIAH